VGAVLSFSALALLVRCSAYLVQALFHGPSVNGDVWEALEGLSVLVPFGWYSLKACPMPAGVAMSGWFINRPGSAAFLKISFTY